MVENGPRMLLWGKPGITVLAQRGIAGAKRVESCVLSVNEGRKVLINSLT